MRASIAAAGLLCLASATSARADEIKDLDKWIGDFTEAAGRTDSAAMYALIQPYEIVPLAESKFAEYFNRIRAAAANAKVLHVEQFNGMQIGNFARRINVAVIYSNGQQYYTLTFLKGEQGWRFNQIKFNNDLSEVLKMT